MVARLCVNAWLELGIISETYIAVWNLHRVFDIKNTRSLAPLQLLQTCPMSPECGAHFVPVKTRK